MEVGLIKIVRVANIIWMYEKVWCVSRSWIDKNIEYLMYKLDFTRNMCQ